MISNRCARKYLVTNCNSIISKNYLRFLVDSNDPLIKTIYWLKSLLSVVGLSLHDVPAAYFSIEFVGKFVVFQPPTR